jgi:hypothetical protein
MVVARILAALYHMDATPAETATSAHQDTMIDFIDAPDAGERHGNVEFLANDFDGRCHSRLAASAEAIERC